ncbi:uncharacterized protein LOC132719295 [Ruditapes philippinarum]|uniref:uncharacterized protein LOC132719295 n=1 Tax=Ruditapes philippinarum TaxID=129788 RepID=UPI00295A5F35|nr:uncharacterized protein LOC132719295 [Ruditapes philippinarum]
MLIKNILFIFGMISAVKGASIIQRRDAFDPEKLMDRYMDMRTNQGLFGSYHPNDLVQSIIDFFSQGDKQPTTDNQWGLYVYNPSDKMTQYMGNLKSPGNLGPQMGGENGGKQEASNSNGGFAFNPNALNSKLLNDALTKGSEFSNFKQQHAVQTMAGAKGNMGFDPDTLNQNMLENALKKGSGNNAGNIKTTTAPSDKNTTDKSRQTSNQAYGSQMLGFNPDTLNAGLLKSINSQTTDNGGVLQSAEGNTNAKMLGFNPDQVNANLISSLDYNPNAATANANNAMSGETVQGAGTDVHHHSNQGSGQINGKATANSNIGSTGNGNNRAIQTTGNQRHHALNEASNPFQTNIESGRSSMTSMFSVNKNGVMPASGEVSSFKAGGMGIQGYGNQNPGAPPGVPVGSELKQTETAPAEVHGISPLI